MDRARRRLLTALGTTGVAAFAGCSGDDDGTDSPSREVTNDDGGTDPPPRQVTKLVADDGEKGDRFGYSVAVSGDGSIAVIGSLSDDNTNGENAGSAYVFEASDGGWSQEATLVAGDGGSLGTSIAVSDGGSTAIIGGQGDDDPLAAGSVYVFGESDGEWSQEAKVVPDDGDRLDRFGYSVAASDDGSTAVIGARNDEDPNGEHAGAAYVFERSGGGWSQEAKLAADDGGQGDLFGESVGVSGDGSTAVVGAIGADNPNGAGAAYVFEGTDDGWTQEAKLVVETDGRLTGSGMALGVSGDGATVVMDGFLEEAPDEGRGSAYVFTGSDGEWSQEATLASNDAEDGFASAVAVSDDGSTALVGAPNDGDPNGEGAGSAYLFERSSGGWSQGTKLVADDGDTGDGFGDSIAVSDDGSTALVGTDGDDGPNGEEVGSAYVFQWNSTAKSG